MTFTDQAAAEARRAGVTRRALIGAGAAGAVTLAIPGAARGAARPRVPDMVLLNGEVHPFDRGYTVEQAIAIRRGRVVETGSTREIRKLVGRRTKVTVPMAPITHGTDIVRRARA